MSHIEDLAQRLEEQEDLLQKHEEIIKKLVQTVNAKQQMPYNEAVHSFSAPSETPKISNEKHLPANVFVEMRNNKQNSKSVARPKVVKTPLPEKSAVRVSFTTKPTEIYTPQPITSTLTEESESDSDENLDDELVEELAELSTEEELNLKKNMNK